MVLVVFVGIVYTCTRLHKYSICYDHTITLGWESSSDASGYPYLRGRPFWVSASRLISAKVKIMMSKRSFEYMMTSFYDVWHFCARLVPERSSTGTAMGQSTHPPGCWDRIIYIHYSSIYFWSPDHRFLITWSPERTLPLGIPLREWRCIFSSFEIFFVLSKYTNGTQLKYGTERTVLVRASWHYWIVLPVLRPTPH